MTKQEKHRMAWGYFFIAPTIIGLLCFVFIPIIYSFIVSFHSWDMITPMKWVGFNNYIKLFTDDERYINSIKATFKWVLLVVPATNISALLIALLLNSKVKGMSLFRTMFYIPSIVPIVASVVLWQFIYNPTFGLMNSILELFHLPPQQWLFDTNLALPSLVLMAVWGSGGTMIIYLAALQSVPAHLYEAVEIDGGGKLRKFWNVTLPSISPILLFNGIMSFIGSMQSFVEANLMTGGGPADRTRFYMLDLFDKVFVWRDMGIASASAWVLFVIIGIVTFVFFKVSKMFVFYENEVSK
jgi:multiple sugar transport system permease protein